MAGQTPTAERIALYKDHFAATPSIFTVGEKTYVGSYLDYWKLREKTEVEVARARTPEEREAAVRRYSPTDETPDPVFSTLDRAVDAGIIAAITGGIMQGLGGAMEWLSGWSLPDFSTLEAVGGETGAFDSGIGLGDVWNYSSPAVESGGFSLPSWASDFGQWGIDLGKSAVEQIVKQEVMEEFQPSMGAGGLSRVGGTAQAGTGTQRTLPQENAFSLGGLLSLINPRAQVGSSGGAPLYSVAAPQTARTSEGGLFAGKGPIILVAVGMIALLAFFMFRR